MAVPRALLCVLAVAALVAGCGDDGEDETVTETVQAVT